MQDEAEFLRVKGLDTDEVFGTVDNVVEEKEDMIDFGLLEQEKAAQHIDHNIDECIEGTAALETYTQILKAAGWDGVSKQTAKAMAVGLRRIDRMLGDKSPLTVALEDETGGDIKRIGNDQSQAATGEGLGARAKEMWKKFLEWVKKHFEQMKVRVKSFTETTSAKIKKKFDDVTEGMKSYNPNNRSGGIKITVPARTAALACPGGKYEDMESVLKTHIWLKDVLVPYLKTQVQKIVSLKGTESQEDIEGMLDKEVPTPSVVPASCDWVAEKGLVFKDGDVTELTVRPLAQAKATLKAVQKTNDWVNDNALVLVDISDIILEMINKSYELNMSGGAGIYHAIQTQIRHVQTAADMAFNSRVRLNDITGAVLDLMGFEMSPGKKQEEEVSNENYDYGLEDDGKKSRFQRMLEFFRQLWEKAKARWEKLMRSPEVIEAKVETTKEEVKQRYKEQPAEEKAPEKQVRTIKIDRLLATRVFSDQTLIMPNEFISLGKHVAETLPAYFEPLVSKLEAAFKAGDAEALQALTVELPKFGEELPNGTRLNYDEGTVKLIFMESEPFETETLGFEKAMQILEQTNGQNKIGEAEKRAGKDLGSLNNRLSAFSGAIINSWDNKDIDTETISAALRVQEELSKALNGARALTTHYYDCLFTYLTLTLL